MLAVCPFHRPYKTLPNSLIRSIGSNLQRNLRISSNLSEALPALARGGSLCRSGPYQQSFKNKLGMLRGSQRWSKLSEWQERNAQFSAHLIDGLVESLRNMKAVIDDVPLGAPFRTLPRQSSRSYPLRPLRVFQLLRGKGFTRARSALSMRRESLLRKGSSISALESVTELHCFSLAHYTSLHSSLLFYNPLVRF